MSLGRDSPDMRCVDPAGRAGRDLGDCQPGVLTISLSPWWGCSLPSMAWLGLMLQDQGLVSRGKELVMLMSRFHTPVTPVFFCSHPK